MRTALTITHVAFEDAGTLGAELARAGFALETLDACSADLRALDPLGADLLVVLGGPIGVYEGAAYPFIEHETDLLRARLAARKPTIGICLGAQLLAAALGARVYPGGAGKEIGWAPVHAARDAAHCPAINALFAPALRVLHWHGDTFDLPAGALHLAASERYPNQAFALDNYALALQFHPEVGAANLERWYVGHACELAHAGIAVPELREDGRHFAPALESAARDFWRRWLADAFA